MAERQLSEPGPVVVLDDDPTGTQSASGARVLLDTSDAALRSWFGTHEPSSVYVLTNSRALTGADAQAIVGRIARVVDAEWPGTELVLRGDSTLRGHVGEEYLGVARGSTPVLLLAPAMPGAGRVTLDGHHYLLRGGRRVSLDETEYAADPDLGYGDAHLLRWAEQRSGGLFKAREGVVVTLSDLRAGGGGAVSAALGLLAHLGRPAVCAVDAETDEDVGRIAEGLTRARQERIDVVVRCAPPLAAILAGCTATTAPPAPAVDGRVLVVAASYVPLSTEQLEAYDQRYPGTTVVADLHALIAAPGAEQDRLAVELSKIWRTNRVAALVTPRAIPQGPVIPRGIAIARNLAGTLTRLAEKPSVVVAKGGVTSAVTARNGLHASSATVLGPLRPGIALWSLQTPGSATLPYVVFPGNVGERETLADLVCQLIGARDARSVH